MSSSKPVFVPVPTLAKRCSGCLTRSWRIPPATRASICSPVSKALLYAFGAGFMLSVAMIELLPEAFSRSGPVAPVLVLAGYLAVHFTQHTLTPHFHFGEETHAISSVAGTSALVGLLLHTFFDGVAIASAFLVRPELGLMVFVAIFLHKLPEGVTISSIMMAGGRTGSGALGAAALLGVATLAGVILTDQVGFLVQHGLALSAGVAIYVAASNLVPELQGKRSEERRVGK